MWQIVESMATLVQGIIYFWFLSRLLDSKYDRRTTDILAIVAAVVFMLAEICLNIISERNSNFILSIFVFLYTVFVFKNTILDKLAGFLAIEMLIAFVAQFSMYTFSWVFHMEPIEIAKGEGAERLFILILVQVLCWALAKSMLYMANRWGEIWKDKKVLVTSVISILFLGVFRQTVFLSGEVPAYHYIIVIFAGLLGTNVLVIYLVGKFYEHREELKRYEIQMKNAEEVYRVNEESRKLRHDMKNMLLVSIGYLEAGKAEKALDYLKTIQEEKVRADLPVICENEELSYLLTAKRQKCREQNIVFHYAIFTKLAKIPGVDLGIILGNLLDNAIEGISKEDGRRIDLYIEEQNGCYKLKVQNSIDHTVLGNNRNLFTTKENVSEHGWGIKSVKTVVKKYHGICEFSEAKGMFTAEVLLPAE